jgi:hypothetical protein
MLPAYSGTLGFIDTGEMLSFVDSVADLYKKGKIAVAFS